MAPRGHTYKRLQRRDADGEAEVKVTRSKRCPAITCIAVVLVWYFIFKAEGKSEAKAIPNACRSGDLASVVTSRMNENKDPCEDFYQFACGEFDLSAHSDSLCFAEEAAGCWNNCLCSPPWSSGVRSVKNGAATSINCAVNPELNSQECFYYADCRPVEPSSLSRDEQVQEQLWEISVNIVKDYLSPEVLEKYGPAHTAAPPPGGEEQQPASTEQTTETEETGGQQQEGTAETSGAEESVTEEQAQEQEEEIQQAED